METPPVFDGIDVFFLFEERLMHRASYTTINIKELIMIDLHLDDILNKTTNDSAVRDIRKCAVCWLNFSDLVVRQEINTVRTICSTLNNM